MLQGVWRLKAQVRRYIDAKRSLKTCFSKKSQKKFFCKKSRHCNHNNRTLFIIMYRWKFNTKCDHIAYIVFGNIWKHSMFHLRHQKRDQQVSIRSIVMEYFRSRIPDVLTFEENFHAWRFLFVKTPFKNIFKFQDEMDIKTKWWTGNKHTTERDRTRSVY